MEVSVFDIKGKDTGRKVTLSEDVFALEANEHVVYLDVKRYLASQRQGTHKAKERGEVSGSTKKLKKQKGTGTARAGSIKSPLFRGGGRVFGPRPRNYSVRLNKKVTELARKVALSAKLRDGELTVVENVNFDQPKTKSYLSFLKSFEAEGKKSLLLLPGYNKNVVLAARNLQDSAVLKATDVNTYEILKASKLLLTEDSVVQLEGILKK